MNSHPLEIYLSVRKELSATQISLIEDYFLPGLEKQAENIRRMVEYKKITFVEV